MPADPLSPLLDLPGVSAAADEVVAAIDRVYQEYRHPANRRGWPAAAAEASMRAARASAALEVEPGTPTPRPMAQADPVLAGAVRVAGAVGRLLDTWRRAPLQALARMHVLAAADLVTESSALGRPRVAEGVSARLQLLASLVTGPTAVPGVVLAAVVHGELLSLAPFGTADGVVARAASRLTALTSGLDPRGLAVPEVGHLQRAAEYRSAAAGFATGDPAAVADWLSHCCAAWLAGAREASSIAAAVR